MSIQIKTESGYLGSPTMKPIQKYTLVGDRVEETHSVIVHQFKLSDTDDPDMYAAHPLLEWQRSEQGQWIMKHSVATPTWHRRVDYSTYGYSVVIQAWLKGADYTFYTLKWGQTN